MKTKHISTTVSVSDSLIGVTLMAKCDKKSQDLEKLLPFRAYNIKDGDVSLKFIGNYDNDREYPFIIMLSIYCDVKYNTVETVNAMSRTLDLILDMATRISNSWDDLRGTIANIKSICHKLLQTNFTGRRRKTLRPVT